mmetsp:Transcript_473/g.899  ORF Transcript_473/g.899 Transcript_473/m.899 type:complete len:167 (-) Transcript_473:167-667(-)|eukprot:CAMPEP_0170177862 /NCGR_PEP_ID=MMETSP0040_2-20121228/11244_1 /TAXON_ID=641309 /ORGANISM="Lotharella oceanica, Strain CCMP622" /LENGTH=166 /DNA_ID=CAMNT_0010420699 /DNA_START=62 /DNA_END=562 /DNA_ORIENTATION=+
MAEDENMDFLDKSQKETGMPTDHTATYYGVALGLSVLPVFLFYTVYKLEDIGVVYLIVTTISTFLLKIAYQKVMEKEYHRLWAFRKQDSANAHKKFGLSPAEYETKRKELTSYESLMFSLFRNNLTYVMFFLFFAFYAFKDINQEFAYAVSVGASSVLVWKFSGWL